MMTCIMWMAIGAILADAAVFFLVLKLFWTAGEG
jgi:hypothetical protein